MRRRAARKEMQVATTFNRAKSTEEIRRIIVAYPDLVDRGDIAGVAQLLDGVKMCNSNGILAPESPEDEIPTLTADEIRNMYAGVIFYEDGLPHTKHMITNIDIRFTDDGRKAASRCSYTVLQGFDDFPLQVIIAGRYEDTYEFDGTAWRLRIRREYADLVGDLSRHVKPEVLEMLQSH
jgi:hypothetical protein